MKRILLTMLASITCNVYAITIIIYDEHNQIIHQTTDSLPFVALDNQSYTELIETQTTIDEQASLIDVVTTDTVTKEKFVIGAWPNGFFSAFLGVLGNLLWADKNDRMPVVYWGPRSLYYQPSGYNGSMNAWEYYFEPVSEGVYEIGDPVHAEYKAPDNSQIPYHQHHDQNYRAFLHTLIAKYIRIKPVVQEKIDEYYNKFMASEKVVGVHLRGTDKHWEIILPRPERLIAEANKVAQQIGATTFLVATDENKLLSLAQRTLAGKVLFYDAQRSNNYQPVHTQQGNQKAHIGEEVLIEAQLLSRCDWFVCSYSNVAYATYFFNPDLPESFIKSRRDIKAAKLGQLIACACQHAKEVKYKVMRKIIKKG